MRTIGLCLVALLTPARAFAAEPSIFIEDALGELADRLRVELPTTTIAADRAAADIAIHLSLELRLTIVDRSGTVIIDRTLTGTRAAVVRAATLLIVDAKKSWEPPREDQPSPPPSIVAESAHEEAVPWKLGSAVGFGVAWRWSATEPQLVYSLAFSIAHGALEASLIGAASGFGCCAISSEAIESEPTAFSVSAQGRWIVLEPLEAIDVSILAAIGYEHESADTRAIGGFAGPGILEHPSDSGPIARAGLALGVRSFDPLTLRLDAGAQFEGSFEVGLPNYPEYVGVRGATIARRPVSPFLALSVGFGGF